MTDAEIGQLDETQAWYAHRVDAATRDDARQRALCARDRRDAVTAREMTTVSYVTSWDDESADIRREQERDAREDEYAILVRCAGCDESHRRDELRDGFCATCHVDAFVASFDASGA
jgi:hypothetical protein